MVPKYASICPSRSVLLLWSPICLLDVARSEAVTFPLSTAAGAPHRALIQSNFVIQLSRLSHFHYIPSTHILGILLRL